MPVRPSPIVVPVVGEDKLSKKLDSIAQKTKRFKQSTDRIGGALTRNITLPLAAAGGVSVKFARDFNQGMAKISTLIPGQTGRIKDLKKQIMKLSADTGAPLEDLTEGVYTAISAWGDSAETMKKMEVATRASQAGIASTGETLGLITSLTEIYGDSTADAVERTADLAFTANKLAVAAPFAEMASVMGEAAAAGSDIGVSQKELFAIMAAGAGVTGSVRKVSTQMRSMFTMISKETPASSKLVKKYNDETGTSYATVGEMMKGSNMSVMDFLKRLKASTKNAKEFSEAVGGAEEGKLIVRALMGARGTKYDEFMKEATERTGQMAEAHRQFADGINADGYKMEQAKRRLINQAVVIGDKLLPVVSKLTDQIVDMLGFIEDMDPDELEQLIKLLGSAMIMGPAIQMTGSLVNIIGGFSMAAKSVRAATLSINGMNAAINAANVGKLSATAKILKSLPAAGFVAAAGALGYGIGTLVHEFILAPAANKGAKSAGQAEDERYNIKRKQMGGKGTIESKIDAINKLDKQGEKIGAYAATFEGRIGSMAAAVGLNDYSPYNEAQKAWAENRKMRDQLAKEVAAMKAGNAPKEVTVKMEIQNGSSSGVTATSGKTKTVVPANTGRVMDGV